MFSCLIAKNRKLRKDTYSIQKKKLKCKRFLLECLALMIHILYSLILKDQIS